MASRPAVAQPQAQVPQAQVQLPKIVFCICEANHLCQTGWLSLTINQLNKKPLPRFFCEFSLYAFSSNFDFQNTKIIID